MLSWFAETTLVASGLALVAPPGKSVPLDWTDSPARTLVGGSDQVDDPSGDLLALGSIVAKPGLADRVVEYSYHFFGQCRVRFWQSLS